MSGASRLGSSLLDKQGKRGSLVSVESLSDDVRAEEALCEQQTGAAL